jgi:hypothetical protein
MRHQVAMAAGARPEGGERRLLAWTGPARDTVRNSAG